MGEMYCVSGVMDLECSGEVTQRHCEYQSLLLSEGMRGNDLNAPGKV